MLFNLGNLEEYKFTKDIVILYHGGCVDGFTGAWAAYKKSGDNADYFGITDREIIPDGLTGKEVYLTGKEVYMIDICFPQELNSFPRVNPWYPVASHHITMRFAQDGWHISLRSNKSISDFDTTIIAIKYGEGGHRNASSFDCDTDLLSKILKSEL
jgi:hypothetical protein